MLAIVIVSQIDESNVDAVHHGVLMSSIALRVLIKGVVAQRCRDKATVIMIMNVVSGRLDAQQTSGMEERVTQADEQQSSRGEAGTVQKVYRIDKTLWYATHK